MSNSNIIGIGDRIKELREAHHQTQADLAKALNVKRETVNQWENGTRDLKTQYTVMLAKHFNTTCDHILRGIKPENVDIHDKTGLSDKSIDKLKWQLENPDIKTNLPSIRDPQEGPKTIYINHFIKAVNALIADSAAIWYLSRFLFSEYTHPQNPNINSIDVLEKGTDIPLSIPTDDINYAFLFKAQEEIIKLRLKLKEGK